MKTKRIIAGICFFLIILNCGACALPAWMRFAEPETTTEPPLLDENGDVIPVYNDVALSVLEPELFLKDEKGRMYYADSSVSMYTGIDISVHQGEIDWAAVKNDGIDFVMLRAGYRGYGTEGKMSEDANFRTNCENALQAGLKVGVYFFSQAINVKEAREEADFVLKIIKDYDITYPVAYDWEVIDYDTARTDGLDNETISQCALAFCERVAKAGYHSSIYFNCALGYFSYDLSLVKDHHFWLAEYKDAPSFIYDFRIWQYTDAGTVEGVSTKVDLNISLTDFSDEESVG